MNSKSLVLIYGTLLLTWAEADTRRIQYEIIQDSTSRPSTIRLSAGVQMGINGGLGEAVIQSYNFIPGLFLEERLRGSQLGLELFPWSWYETETKVGFRIAKHGHREAGFTLDGYDLYAQIPAERTWIPYLGLQTIHQRLSLTDEEKKEPVHDPLFVRPGLDFVFAIGLHRDIAHPYTKFKPVGYQSSTLWNFATTNDVGFKYYTMEYYNQEKKKYVGGYAVFFWNWERFYTPFTLGCGLEITYFNEMRIANLFHFNLGVNFKN